MKYLTSEVNWILEWDEVEIGSRKGKGKWLYWMVMNGEPRFNS